MFAAQRHKKTSMRGNGYVNWIECNHFIMYSCIRTSHCTHYIIIICQLKFLKTYPMESQCHRDLIPSIIHLKYIWTSFSLTVGYFSLFLFLFELLFLFHFLTEIYPNEIYFMLEIILLFHCSFLQKTICIN